MWSYSITWRPIKWRDWLKYWLLTATLAHEYAAALAQGAAVSFDNTGLAFTFEAGPVLPAGQDLGYAFHSSPK